MTHEHPTQPVRIDLRGKTVVVTGGGSGAGSLLGLGGAIALYAASAGAQVAVVDRDLESAVRTLAHWNDVAEADGHDRMITVEADVTDLADCERIVSTTVEAFGPIDGLVNNVGIAGPRGTALDVDMDAWDAAMRTNVASMVLMSRAVIARRERDCSIINMSSVAGIRGGHHALSYSTTKSAVVGMTRAMAVHHGPAGVRVNALVPGLAYTPMVANRGMSDAQRAARANAGVLKREGTAWDVAGAAAFLLSDASSWITAQALEVDGGIAEHIPNLGVAQVAASAGTGQNK